MRVAREEIFGPVAVVIKFKDEAEVVKMANDSNYGLGGAVWTQDINRAIRVAKAVQTAECGLTHITLFRQAHRLAVIRNRALAAKRIK